MNTQLLESFLRVLEFGSINRAAKDLGVTQPALSRALRELERDIGRPLVIRRRTGITATDAGTILAARAPEFLQYANEFRNQLADEPATQVVIGMPTPVRTNVSVPLIRELRTAAPKTKIRIFEGFNVYIKDLLNQGILDIAVIPENLVPVADFDQIPLAVEPIILYRRFGLPKPPDPSPLEETLKYSMSMPGRPNAVRTLLEDGLKVARLPAPDVVLEPENMEIAFLLLRAGCVDQCAAIGRQFATSEQAGMWISNLENLELRWMLAINRKRAHMASVQRTRRLVEKVVSTAIAENLWIGAKRLNPKPLTSETADD